MNLARWLLVYLGNHEPSEESLGSLSVEEKSKFVRTSVNGELDMSEENEVIDVILNSANSSIRIDAAFRTFSVMDRMKRSLLGKLRTDLDGRLKSHRYALVWNPGKATLEGMNANATFGIVFRPGHDKYLAFEFEYADLRGLFWGIAKRDESVTRDSESWDGIRSVMDHAFGQGRHDGSDWWPWYSTATDQALDADQIDDWWSDSAPWIAINDGTLVDKIVDLACRVHQAFEKESSKMDLLLPGPS